MATHPLISEQRRPPPRPPSLRRQSAEHPETTEHPETITSPIITLTCSRFFAARIKGIVDAMGWSGVVRLNIDERESTRVDVEESKLPNVLVAIGHEVTPVLAAAGASWPTPQESPGQDLARALSMPMTSWRDMLATVRVLAEDSNLAGRHPDCPLEHLGPCDHEPSVAGWWWGLEPDGQPRRPYLVEAAPSSRLFVQEFDELSDVAWRGPCL